MNTKRFALFLFAFVLLAGLAPVPAADAAITSTGAIVNSSGGTPRCVCSVRCVSSVCLLTAPAAPAFCALTGTLVNGQVASCSGNVPVGGSCNCAVGVSNKKIRLLACMEGDPGGVTPLVCADGY